MSTGDGNIVRYDESNKGNDGYVIIMKIVVIKIIIKKKEEKEKAGRNEGERRM